MSGNLAKDLVLIMRPDTREEVELRFRFGKCENFRKALRMVKRIRKEERGYDPDDDHLWVVQVSEQNLRLLCLAFGNFQEMHDLARNQL